MQHRFTFALALLLLLHGCGGSSDGPLRIGPNGHSPGGQAVVHEISYPLQDFDRIAINGSFTAVIRRAEGFGIDLLVDDSVVEQLAVTLSGETLDIRFQPGSDIRADVLEAVIELPALSVLTLQGSNFVEISGFEGGSLTIATDGTSRLDVRDARYDFVSASVNGQSLIEYVDAAALPALDIEMIGSSTATVNLMDFAAVTGTLGGTSNLHYYGTDINFSVALQGEAAITRLGATRPYGGS